MVTTIALVTTHSGTVAGVPERPCTAHAVAIAATTQPTAAAPCALRAPPGARPPACHHPTASGSATVYLPTAFGYSNSANATDGAFARGTGPLMTIAGKDVNGNALTDAISFPNTGGKFSKADGKG